MAKDVMEERLAKQADVFTLRQFVVKSKSRNVTYIPAFARRILNKRRKQLTGKLDRF
jgi:ABC-type phosphate transport system auxiliary subunit